MKRIDMLGKTTSGFTFLLAATDWAVISERHNEEYIDDEDEVVHGSEL